MVQEITTPKQSGIVYPESDGKPMADNTLQFRWIVTIKENIDFLFSDRDDILVVGDLLWYPVEGNNQISRAPDVMVVFDRPKGDRRSYLQWREDDIPPQVVFEILSHNNTLKEMAKKLDFYQKYGVEEYYLYDPMSVDFCGWLRSEDGLTAIEEIDNWVSPRLGIRFVLGEEELEIYRPDGKRFLTPVELAKLAEQESDRAQQAENRVRQLEERLRQAGIDPEQL